MRLWKAWSEVRQKFFLTFVLVTLLIAPSVVASAVAASGAQAGESAQPGSGGQEAIEAAAAFSRELDGWLSGNAYYAFAILAVVLAVGGILSLGNARSNLLTLSLPGRRRSWLWAQAWVCTFLLFVLCAWEASFFVVTGWLTGLDVPEGRLFVGVILTTFAGALWIWPAILGTALTRDGVQAALVVVTLVVILELLGGAFGQPAFRFQDLASVTQWQTAVPWEPLLPGVLLAALSAWSALARFKRMEF